jgi:hypothetical protein
VETRTRGNQRLREIKGHVLFVRSIAPSDALLGPGRLATPRKAPSSSIFCGQLRALPGRIRCRLHGGASTGPTTPEGMARTLAAMQAGRLRWLSKLKAQGKPIPCGPIWKTSLHPRPAPDVVGGMVQARIGVVPGAGFVQAFVRPFVRLTFAGQLAGTDGPFFAGTRRARAPHAAHCGHPS